MRCRPTAAGTPAGWRRPRSEVRGIRVQPVMGVRHLLVCDRASSPPQPSTALTTFHDYRSASRTYVRILRELRHASRRLARHAHRHVGGVRDAFRRADHRCRPARPPSASCPRWGDGSTRAAAALAAEIAHRSRHELGHDGLAQRLGARTPQILVQRVTGATAREAQTLVRVGSLVAPRRRRMPVAGLRCRARRRRRQGTVAGRGRA